MASQPSNIDDDKIYRKMKFSFVKKCIQHVKDNYLEEEWPCTYESIIKYQEIVLEAKQFMKNDAKGGFLTCIHQRVIERYDVQKDTGQKMSLVLKNYGKKVVDVFSSFDIIKQAHTTEGTYHKDLDQTMDSVDSMYYIPKMAVEIFLSVCTACLQHNNQIKVTAVQLSVPPLVKIAPKPAPHIKNNNNKTSPSQKPSSQLENMLIHPSKAPIFTPMLTSAATATTADATMSSNLQLPTDHDSASEETVTEKVITDVLKTTTENSLPVQTLPQKNLSFFSAKSGNVFADIVACNKADGIFKHLLIYMDISTNYILLRPVTKMEAEQVSMELFKIFADFGVPPEIHIPPSVYTLFQKVLYILKINFGTKQIIQKIVKINTLTSPDQQKHQSHLLSTGRRVKNRLTLWCTKTQCDNWAVGCFVVQQNMNTEKVRLVNTTPYQSFFNTNRSKLNDKLRIKLIDKLSEEMPRKSVSHMTHEPQMVVNVPTYEHDTVNTNIESEVIELDKDIKEESDVLMDFEEEETQVQFQEVENSRSLQLEHVDALCNTNQIEKDSLNSSQIERIDSLDDRKDIVDNLNCVPAVPPKKSKPVVASTQFEKKFESFLLENKRKNLVSKTDHNRTQNKVTLPSTSKKSNDNGINELSPVIDEEDNQISKSDAQKIVESSECHVCGRKMISSHGNIFVKCLLCYKNVHSMCVSTTFKQKHQNVCLVCMFKDGDPDDSIDLDFGENDRK